MEPSPPLSVDADFDDMTDEQLDMHFANCLPLSNLPTPDPAKHFLSLSTAYSCKESAGAGAPAVQRHVPELEVYATHLSKLVPSNTSLHRPCVGAVHGFLERANLPSEVVAYAACLLDALSQRFARPWRAACLVPNPPNVVLDRRRLPATEPEAIVLAALAIAHGYLSDWERSPKHWARIEGAARFSVRELEATKRCILQDIDYGLAQISETMVDGMLKVMRRASVPTGYFDNARVATVDVVTTTAPATPPKGERRLTLNLDLHPYHGAAVWNFGMPSPEPSP